LKITIPKHVLLEPLQQVSKAVPAKSGNDIFQGILFRTTKDGLTLIGSDFDLAIHAAIEDVTVHSPGEVLLPAKAAIDFTKHMPSGDIEISVSENEKTTFICEQTKLEIMGRETELFPKHTKPSSSEFITIDGSVFKKMIRKTFFAVSDKDEVPILKGVRVSLANGQLDFTGCDKSRLARASITAEGDDSQIVIAGGHLHKIVHAIKDDDETLIHIGGLHTVIKSGIYTIYSQTLLGRYPDQVENLIRSNKSFASMKIPKQRFMESIKRSLITALSSMTMFRISKDKILISSGDRTSKTIDTLTAFDFQGGSMRFACNGDYVLEALQAIDDEEISVRFAGPTDPLYLSGRDGSEIHLVMAKKTEESEWVDR
jgi:DNA polymerase-3 subunit beta